MSTRSGAIQEDSLDSFMRGYRGEYRSVVKGEAPLAETVGRYTGAAVDSFRVLGDAMTGAGNMRDAMASWRREDYGLSLIQGGLAFAEAGMTLAGFGTASAVRSAGTTTLRAETVAVPKSTAGWTQLSSRSRAYVRDIEAQTGTPLTDVQRNLLTDDIRVNEYSRLSPAESARHRTEFNRVKNDLISEWEFNTGQTWPTYTDPVFSKNGTTLRRVGQPYDAHHVIESSYGGPNKWWIFTLLASLVSIKGGYIVREVH